MIGWWRVRDFLWGITPVLTTRGRQMDRDDRKARNGFEIGRDYQRGSVR